ncbi:hypothetical protein ACF090_43435, partial [Streptomyces sp. NPDC014892]|uniref:hypothetical protein n=1 Tax=Streptomyces sp. NPDC014892 TaxID=3364930 RepID=UPI003702F88E
RLVRIQNQNPPFASGRMSIRHNADTKKDSEDFYKYSLAMSAIVQLVFIISPNSFLKNKKGVDSLLLPFWCDT